MPAYYDEAHKTWYAKFRYTDWQGQSRFTTKRGFATKREAKAYETATKTQLTSAPTLTLNQLYELYIKDLSHRVKASTLRVRKVSVAKNILPYLGGLLLSDIKPINVREWQNTIESAGKSPSTVKNLNATLSAIFNYAVKFYGMKSNPIHIAGSRGRMIISQAFWTPDEFNKFIDCIDYRPAEIAFRTLFYTGMRLGELLALNLKDITDGTITISKTYDSAGHMITSPKTETSNRIITVPKQVTDMLMELAEMYEEPPERLFQCMYVTCLRDYFMVGIKKAGVPQIRIHDLRHSHASFLIQQNIPITAISRRLGHKDAGVTLKVYSHMYKDNDKQISEIVGHLLVSEK